MATAAIALYWLIVLVWICVLVCTLYYSRGETLIFGSAKLLLAVVAIDTVRDIVENIYFGIYFGSQYGLFSKSVATVLGRPILLMMPKVANVIAGCLVLFILLLRWLPNAAKERQTLGQFATVDAMTGLFNRRHFLVTGEAEFNRSDRHGRPLSMLMLDIDHFKRINDDYGHDVGDQIIAEVARVCQRISRDSDIVARLGGEEFGILLPETTLLAATNVAERLRIAVAESNVSGPDGKLKVSVSIGVGERSRELELAELIKHADVALYDAKRSGRNRVCTYTTEAV